MSTPNRATLLIKLHKVLKKHYKPIETVSSRTVLEHLLYGCCLENAKYDDADDAFAKLQQNYFDWNEVRVTTVAELSETLSDLPNPSAAATNLKKSLQGLFEAVFTYDLELMKKQNLGKSEQDLAKYIGDNKFVIAYVAQHGLGGHSIPCGQAEMDFLFVLGGMSEQEYDKRQIPGMERAIPKNKGIEFSSLLHQLAVEFKTAPNSTKLKAIVFEIESGAKERLTMLAQKKAAPQPLLVVKSKEVVEQEKLVEATAKAKALAEKHRAQKAEAQEKKRAEAAAAAKSSKPDHIKKMEPPKKRDDKHHAPKSSGSDSKKSESKKIAKKKPR